MVELRRVEISCSLWKNDKFIEQKRREETTKRLQAKLESQICEVMGGTLEGLIISLVTGRTLFRGPALSGKFSDVQGDPTVYQRH
jgi:hypothetical protein